ncbi:YggS family pyridoxal phosphate-dependent enzyme [Neolewinella aurantiaca]|uniref:Pyridoxal phosphate homeostasis protein n=1 Tax=Neolewinella aurantiaca TaxID=2602767 RepID=A0A5C7FRU3_9BACT|nr:YggS family pyridoxal phosphate-dependent enzyme [Neolewinella aurantiaca]TXF90730.1 YggS family pyridoxal phosphate-dependent enzyme [Neolewinella aurantiaca]
MSETEKVYQELNTTISAAEAQLIAVSKTHPQERIMELYELGHRDFGENRVAELVEKHEALPKDIRWHFIGHLQRNKVKAIAPFVHLIHAVDSERLLREIDKQAKAADRKISVLLQFHIAEEASKYGLDREKAGALITSLKEKPLTHTTISGVMGMATFTDDEAQVTAEFESLAEHFKWIQGTIPGQSPEFREISMGMSGDYPLALAAGSTLVRVGSLLFGQRYT